MTPTQNITAQQEQKRFDALVKEVDELLSHHGVFKIFATNEEREDAERIRDWCVTICDIIAQRREEKLAKLQEDHARLVEGMQQLQRGVDHERGQQQVPEFYECVSWAQDIAKETLSHLNFNLPPTP